MCSGHASGVLGGNQYHYHVVPSCLLDQLGDYHGVNGHSPLIGWAFDGFPIYGPHGLDGGLIYGCSHSNADSADCVDECNGHGQHEIDGFKYHYHILGPIGDLTTSPLHPVPSQDFSPYTIGCYKGAAPSWLFGSVIHGMPNNAECADNGTVDGFEPEPVDGVTDIYGYHSFIDSSILSLF